MSVEEEPYVDSKQMEMIAKGADHSVSVGDSGSEASSVESDGLLDILDENEMDDEPSELASGIDGMGYPSREHSSNTANASVEVDGGIAMGHPPGTTRQRAPQCPLDLPFSVVRRLMKAAAPHKRFTPEVIAAFARGGGVFGLYLLSACQEATDASGKRTIRPSDVVTALSACGFPELAEEVRVSLNITMLPKKKKSKRTRRN